LVVSAAASDAFSLQTLATYLNRSRNGFLFALTRCNPQHRLTLYATGPSVNPRKHYLEPASRCTRIDDRPEYA
jgi:hypothetical protein